jgi:hypothetical protein
VTSTLTAEDENILAPAILQALTHLLEQLPIAYRIRVDTIDSRCYQQHGPGRSRKASDGRWRTPLFAEPQDL